MAKKKDYKRDGLSLYNAVFAKGFTVTQTMDKLQMSRQTLYNYYETETFDTITKERFAKAFELPVEEMFGLKSNDGDEVDLKVQLSSNKEVITFGKHIYRKLRPEEYNEAYKDWRGVPMYNVPVTASFVASYRDETSIVPQYYLHDPRFKDCNFGAIITGDSMYSEIRHGDFVLCQEITDKDFVVYGDIYYVVSTNGLETCKYLNADPNNKDNYLLVPRNDSISPSPLPKRMIQRLFKVRGVLRGY